MGQLETQLGRNQLDRHSWTGTSYSHETGSRPTGFSYVYKYLLVPSRIDSNKQCFHNQYMHTCLLRATVVGDLGSPSSTRSSNNDVVLTGVWDYACSGIERWAGLQVK